MQYTTLAGSGCTLGATEIVLTSFAGIEGTALTMASFGTKGFMTLEPSNSTQEEQISFSGITQNANGTATLTGVKNVLFISPFTETSGTAKSHPGGSKAVVSNTVGFYNSINQYIDLRNGYWEEAVANYAALPAGVTNGEARVTLDDSKLYVWDGASWVLAGSGGGAGTVYITTLLGTQSTGDDNRTFTLTSGSFPEDKYLQVYKNGALMENGASADYITSGSNAAVFNAAVNDIDKITLIVVSIDLYNPAWTAVNDDILPDITNTYDIGTISSAGLIFRNLSISGTESGKRSGSDNKLVDSKAFHITAANYGTSTTGTTAYVVGLNAIVTTYTAGLVVNFKPDAGGGHATLNINSLGAKNITTYNNGTLAQVLTGDIVANQNVVVMYDGTQFQMLSNRAKPAKAATGSATISSSTTVTHVTGFRPSRIDVVSASGGGTGISGAFSIGVYTAATDSQYATYQIYNANGSNNSTGVNTAAVLHHEYGTNPTGTTALINNVTDNGFDMVYTKGTSAPDYVWTAIG